MTKIAGNVVGIPNPQSDWNQLDATKADFIKNKPTVLTENDVLDLIEEQGGGGGDGVGIADIYSTADDTGRQMVVITTLTDGRTLSFGIPYGKDGKGIESMAYYDTTLDGQVGIYVWYTDGTTEIIWIPNLKGEGDIDFSTLATKEELKATDNKAIKNADDIASLFEQMTWGEF